MRETIEFRIDEELARKFLEPGVGSPISDTLRRVVLPLNDQRVRRIGEIQREHRARGAFFFLYSEIHRAYSEEELQAAELLELIPRARFEPSGSMCGTEYDESGACEHCGSGGHQVSELLLNTRRIPKGKDVAQTIAGEIVISSRVVDTLVERGIRGAEYRPVMHSGRKGPESSEWRQLSITSKPVALSAQTRAGVNLFDMDEEGKHRCPKGHLAGLNQISELYVERRSVETSDWFCTDKLFGVRRGELRPERRVLISQNLRQVLVDLKAKGFGLEVAHLV
ncbi:hypothetical protein POL68_22890 [Stigmatella sp. ncwal1]|uniref:Uncharacterized protein n=1 Tax=Stigmatella ashevillensis TaxID=2995309 RepID=A0ABT5DDW4_9BACT|nr:hypothetical protein [Stigmatella ashevillena]MDC0711335.1 hypothetical protein [Stigmatella ashevillena]